MTTIKADCDQKNKVEDGTSNVQDNIQGIAISASSGPGCDCTSFCKS
jgi:hypothetical protein